MTGLDIDIRTTEEEPESTPRISAALEEGP
jgi:hypothetical protein